METNITKHPAFLNCNGELIAQLIGGSTLYGLNNEFSDTDYRGIFIARDKKYIAGLENIESIVQTGDIDSTYYELSRYVALLRKSNTQVLEILFAPDSAFTYTTDLFKTLQTHKFNLIDSNILKNSLNGYVFSEIRLATGQRSGQLGSKRKDAVEKYGFSPKNFVQILRLCKVGITFFNSGEYMVKVADYDQTYHNFLMDIKNAPEDFTCEQLTNIVDVMFNKLETAMEDSKISYKFNMDLASDIILNSRKSYV